MDEIDFHGDFVDSNNYEEYFGEGTLESVAPEQLAQSILESLQGLKSSYAVNDADLEPLVGLLNDVFGLVECIPDLRAGYNTSEEERDELERQWRKEKDKYKKRMEERSEYELLLEKENKELKEDLKEMKRKAVDSESRLNTVKTFYEEQRTASEEESQKRLQEYNKLWGIIECYQHKYEQVGADNATVRALRRGHRYLSTKQTHKHSQGSSSESPVHGSPLPPDTPTSPTDTPTFTPFSYKLTLDQPNQSGLSLVEEQKEIELENSRDNPPSAETTTNSTDVHTSEVDPVPVKPRRAPRRLAQESGDFKGDDVPIVDGEESEENSPEDVAPEDIVQYSLAQELLSSDPNYLANTEMTRLLKDLETIQKEKTTMLKEKEGFVEEIASLKKINTALSDDVHLLTEKEDRLKEELARAKDSYVNIEVDNDLSESGLSFCCTKEELFSKLRELMEYKTQCIELKEQLARMRSQMSQQTKSARPLPKRGNFFTKLFKRTPKKSVNSPPPPKPHQVQASKEDYDQWITKKTSINVDNFVSITGWLLGPNAKKMISMLPTVVGKIGLGIYEVERVDCAVVARVTVNQSAPKKPDRQRKELVVTKGAWTQGGIPNKYRSHAMPCNVEIWVATTARNDTKIEVVTTFARASQHIQHMFKVNLSHIQCMKAVSGQVPAEKVEQEQDLLKIPETLSEEIATMWLVSNSGQIHFHEIGALPFKRINAVNLDNDYGAFCIELVKGKVVIGQRSSHLAVFSRNEDGVWGITSPEYVDLSDLADRQDIRCILAVEEELWLGAGDRVIIVKGTSYEPKSGIMIDAIFDKSFKIGEMVSVQDTVVITQHRGSNIILCDAKEKNIIGIFDITDLCSIYEQDKLHLKSAVVVSSICADQTCVYVGTKSGYVLCFSVSTMKEYLLQSTSAQTKERDTPSDDETPKEEVLAKSPIRHSVETSCSAVSLNGHISAVRSLLHVSIPLPETKEVETAPTDAETVTTSPDSTPSQTLQLHKRKKNTPKRFKELVISVGIGHTDFSSVGQGIFNVVTPNLGHKTQVLVWGQPER